MAPRMPKHLLMLEGPDDVGVFYHLFQYYGIPVADRSKPEDNKISLESAVGFENLREKVKLLLKPQDEDI